MTGPNASHTLAQRSGSFSASFSSSEMSRLVTPLRIAPQDGAFLDRLARQVERQVGAVDDA